MTRSLTITIGLFGLTSAAAGPLPDGAVCRFGSGNLRHPGEFHGATFSPDGRRLAILSSQKGHGRPHNVVSVFHGETGEPVARFRLPPSHIAYAAGGSLHFLTALQSHDGTAVVMRLDLKTGRAVEIVRCVGRNPPYSTGTRAIFTRDGSLAVIVTKHGVHVYAVSDGGRVGRWAAPQGVWLRFASAQGATARDFP